MQFRFCIGMLSLIIITGTVWAQELDLKLEWIRLDSGARMRYVSALEGTEHRLYAATQDGILFSENDGNTWSSTTFDIGNKSLTTLTATGNTVYAGTWRHGVFRSDDAGVTWKPINDGFRFQEVKGELFYGEVRRILIIGDTTISVMYHGGTYTSTDRGETWHDISAEWYVGNSIYAMTAFEGYLWTAMSIELMARSPDTGQTWQSLVNFQKGRVNDWAVLNGQLYVAGQKGVGRWNERLQTWEYPMDGLPIDNTEDWKSLPFISGFAVRDGYLLAGLDTHGVYVFDSQSEAWSAVGLHGLSILSLLSHEDFLYAGTKGNSIYRAELRGVPPVSVQRQDKAVTTWAHMKQATDIRD